jgi:GntR family transcriptional repressor for pyruvate dehydrogenase complex
VILTAAERAMETAIQPVLRQSLTDDLAQRIRQLITRRDYQPGDRLPAIAEMARHFAVGGPTVREALRKLETVGVVEIRHGSGVYVGRLSDALVISNPVFGGAITKKLLVDLVEARIPIEVQSVSLAAEHATANDLVELRALLARAGATLDDAALLNQTNLAFHRTIARASDNGVLLQLLEVLGSLFKEEQRLILDIHGSRAHDHAEHLRILDALEQRDAGEAGARMRAHLEGVRDVLRRWDPDAHPVL